MTEVQAALADLREYLKGYDEKKAKQKIADLKAEIKARDALVETLEQNRARCLRLAERGAKSHAPLAYALLTRAGILLEEIERQRPHALTKKLNDALHEQRDVEIIWSVLEDLSPETLDGLEEPRE